MRHAVRFIVGSFQRFDAADALMAGLVYCTVTVGLVAVRE
jgi:hypothetical protein